MFTFWWQLCYNVIKCNSQSVQVSISPLPFNSILCIWTQITSAQLKQRIMKATSGCCWFRNLFQIMNFYLLLEIWYIFSDNSSAGYVKINPSFSSMSALYFDPCFHFTHTDIMTGTIDGAHSYSLCRRQPCDVCLTCYLGIFNSPLGKPAYRCNLGGLGASMRATRPPSLP